MSRNHKLKMHKMRRNEPACCRQVVNLLYIGDLPADSQPHPTACLAVSFQDTMSRCSLQTRLKAGHLRSAGSCALWRGKDQQHHRTQDFLVKLARSLMYDLRSDIFPLSLFPKPVRVSDHDGEYDDIRGCWNWAGKANFALLIYRDGSQLEEVLCIFYWAWCKSILIRPFSSKLQPERDHNQTHLLPQAWYPST